MVFLSINNFCTFNTYLNLKKYISELKRRNVFKAAIAYLIVAWLVTQVSSIVLPTFNAPTYFMKTLLFAFAIGFPIWLVFSWVYEITPDGVRKTKEVKEEESILPKTGNKFNKMIIATLSIAVILLLFNQFRNKSNNKIEQLENSNTSEFVKNKKDSINFIAILPFYNSKPNSETDYLGFALADQIIGDLSYFQNIVVRPSSSIRKYEKQVTDPKTVGNELRVNYVLNGNYLIEDDSIRLNIELIDVNTDEMIWREPIKVDYHNAFELQDIVAKKVIEGMNIKFSENEINNLEKNIPKDPLAYEYYLKSISYPISKEGNQLAIDMLNKSIEIDSSYAPAYNEMGNRINKQINYGLVNQKNYKSPENLYLKALSLNKELISALSNLALFYTEKGKTEEAIEIAKKVLEINPNNASAHFSLGYIYRYTGMNNESISEMEKAISLQPNNLNFQSILITYLYAGEKEKVFEIGNTFKESSFILYYQGQVLLMQKKQKQAVEFFDRAISMDPDGGFSLILGGVKASIEGNRENGLAALKKFEKYNFTDAEAWYHVAGFYSLLGDKESSIRCLRKTINRGFFNYSAMKTNPYFNSMQDDPEFQNVLLQAKEKHLAFKKKHFD